EAVGFRPHRAHEGGRDALARRRLEERTGRELIGWYDRLERHHAPAMLIAELPVPPGHQPTAEGFGVDLQQIADVLERKRPRTVVGADPLLSIEEELTRLAIRGPQMLLEAVDGVLENSDRQATFRLVSALALENGEILRRQQGVGLQQ